ncbi:hypothetical protein BS17DRAFT_775895 [Gyrodon lividus]|nr:hypothetical protein BS17DRAFT_775895 [Gyrodon lividus]
MQLLRCMNDLMDMNTLAEGEGCTICMVKMGVGKYNSLRCRHPVCAERFERSGDGPVQCPHCREICLRKNRSYCRTAAGFTVGDFSRIGQDGHQRDRYRIGG